MRGEMGATTSMPPVRLDFHDHQTTTLLVGGPLGKDRITE